eukprot:2156687-Amphidinium_carterae.1
MRLASEATSGTLQQSILQGHHCTSEYHLTPTLKAVRSCIDKQLKHHLDLSGEERSMLGGGVPHDVARNYIANFRIPENLRLSDHPDSFEDDLSRVWQNAFP